MIIWLASYPRSGNTLLRTILNQTMGLGSYFDEPILPNIGEKDKESEEFWRSKIAVVADTIGILPMTGSWESFYKKAAASNKAHLIKSHLPPRDDQPAIYLLRDGRSALVSYYHYHQNYLKKQKLLMMKKILI